MPSLFRHSDPPPHTAATARARRVAIAAGLVLAVAVVILFLLSDFFLNWYAKGKIEKAFAEAYPEYALTVGTLHFSLLTNEAECRGVTLAAADASLRCNAGAFTISGIGWHTLLLKREITPEVVKTSTLTARDVLVHLAYPHNEVHFVSMRISVPDSEITATDASMEFKRPGYRLTCKSFRASARDSEIYAGTIDLRPLAGDENFFNARPFRRTRFAITVDHCRLRRAPVFEMLKTEAMPGGTLDIVRPEISLLVNREKPKDPNPLPPLMPGDALARIERPFRLDTLLLHDGRLVYAERIAADGTPGILTFDTAQISVFDLSNAPHGVALLRGQARFLNEGVMRVAMRIPLSAGDVALSYTGSLTAMDLRALNRFLEIAEHTRIESAMLHRADFDVRVVHGRGSGTLRMNYDNLSISLLDKESGSSKPLGKRLSSLLANLKIHGSNTPDGSGNVRIGEVKYTRDATDTFMNVTWLSLRSAVQDVVGF